MKAGVWPVSAGPSSSLKGSGPPDACAGEALRASATAATARDFRRVGTSSSLSLGGELRASARRVTIGSQAARGRVWDARWAGEFLILAPPEVRAHGRGLLVG